MKKQSNTGEEWYNAVGNIINLRTTTIDYDKESGRALFNLGADMRYLTQHYDTYIKPLQDSGRKVCISIEGANKGIGFCNLTNEQIEDFVAQVKNVVSEYNFDGINLWDRNAGYGKEGASAVNTTSYPRLIKALREALGNQKLLTITDHGEPTATFYDLSATDDIEVGRYIDYAWSGYYNGDEPVQIVDPYHQGEPNVSSKYPRRPIAGLEPEKYGCINSAWYTMRGNSDPKYEVVTEWVNSGYQQNNIYVYEDIITNLQNGYEGGIWLPNVLISYAQINYGNVYMFDLTYLGKLSNGHLGYGKWLKDW